MLDLQRSHEDFLCDELFDWAFGDDEDDLNEAFLQARAEFESKLRLVQQLHPWFWFSHLQQAPPTTTKPTFSYYSLRQAPLVRLRCQKHHCGSTELHHGSTGIRATILTNQIAVFQIGRL